MENKKGFTLIELLVTLVILGIVLSAVHVVYRTILFDYKEQTKSIESQIEKSLGIEVLRLDLEHVGYGLSVNASEKVIEFDGNDLILRSTINTTNEKTLGFAIANCTQGSNSEYVMDKIVETQSDTNSSKIRDLVIIDLEDYSYVGEKSNINLRSENVYSSCTKNATYILLPYDSSTSSGCSSQFCNEITYSLSSDQTVELCNDNTKNLRRKVGSSSTGLPIINCVADFQVRFKVDVNGTITQKSDISLGLSELNNLKEINVYLLVQEGQEDKKYTAQNSYQMDGIVFNLPSDYQHYRWKIVKISATPHIFGE